MFHNINVLIIIVSIYPVALPTIHETNGYEFAGTPCGCLGGYSLRGELPFLPLPEDVGV
jgi:hypothetical protein